MDHRYAHILQPVKMGNLILKNRLISSKCIPEGIQGPAKWPTEQTIHFAASLAKNGAAIVTCAPGVFRDHDPKQHFTSDFNMEDRHVKRCFRRMIDRIHAHGSVASASTMLYVPSDKNISELYNLEGIPDIMLRPSPESILGRDGKPLPAMTTEDIRNFIQRFARRCAELQSIGFDMVNIYMSYGTSILAKSLSPVFNQRRDEYGGSFENRARLTLELFRAIKDACGRDFPIEIQISGEEDSPLGYRVEDFVRYCKLCEGLVDIFQIRAPTGDLTHASHYTQPKDRPMTLQYAEAFKAAGIRGLCAPVGGYQDLDLIESWIAAGKMDLACMARAFICDEDYGRQLLEGRGEDTRPCIHCDNCHQAYCAVNPKIGLQEVWPDMFDDPVRKKRVAVIGGGPAGMQAAVAAAERGHDVTLFEASDSLGGQLRHADYLAVKWSLHDLKEYLIRKVEKAGVTVKLGTRATPEMIGAHFDAVIAACGAKAKAAPFPVAEDVRVWTPLDVFGRQAELGKNVVVIGGSMTAADTAFYLKDTGHDVTLVTRNRSAGHDYNAHSRGAFQNVLEGYGLNIIKNARTDRVEPGVLHYTQTIGAPEPGMPMGGPGDMPPMGPGMDREPKEPPKTEQGTVAFDSIVVSAGRTGLVEESFAFAGLTPEFYVAGDADLLSFETLQGGPGGAGGTRAEDCTTVGTIRHALYSGYTAAGNL